MSIRVSLQDQYQRASEDELQRLAADFNDLMPDAQKALFAELQVRGLQAHIQTARAVEAEAAAHETARAARLRYFVIADADEKMPGCFQVLAPRGPLRFPDSCPRCGKPADKKCGIAAAHIAGVRRVETLTYQVPHCADCARSAIRAGWLLALAGLAAVTALAVVMSLMMSWQATSLIITAVVFVLLAIRQGRAPLKTPEGIFLLDYDQNSAVFVFRNRAYAKRFCELNSQLINGRAS